MTPRNLHKHCLRCLALVALALGGLTACHDPGPAEEAGREIDQAVEQARERGEEAVDEAQDAIEDAGDEVEEALDEVDG
ncbi:hypothetical protein [Wenzhouxiangella marina]|uniref:Uncharacterized protein n=1 Tax=Wenzhouxiangella marina TaxID=1579979 RepID=A0A0K0Y033_9GAMM|nr:hypothetical protein [Wenzhouxiangella marina]AKS43275.1 hypothetical protein WM2015_2918 [Wenzhouxiangella marina]MBB6087038.1 uncharacterized protein YjbJ (UPF0337 family) [Wenzhouxiangella marina]